MKFCPVIYQQLSFFHENKIPELQRYIDDRFDEEFC